jgi:hypothetical protein
VNKNSDMYRQSIISRKTEVKGGGLPRTNNETLENGGAGIEVSVEVA